MIWLNRWIDIFNAYHLGCTKRVCGGGCILGYTRECFIRSKEVGGHGAWALVGSGTLAILAKPEIIMQPMVECLLLGNVIGTSSYLQKANWNCKARRMWICISWLHWQGQRPSAIWVRLLCSTSYYQSHYSMENSRYMSMSQWPKHGVREALVGRMDSR